MPIDYVIGDATKPYGLGPKVICHCVNDIGKWGSGFVLALAKWPLAEAHYREWYRTGRSSKVVGKGATTPNVHFHLGAVQFVEVEPQLWVANLIGQHKTIRDGEAQPVRYDALEMGFQAIQPFCMERAASAHMPRIGAGLARGDWSRISGIIESTLVSRDVSVTVYDLPGAKQPT